MSVLNRSISLNRNGSFNRRGFSVGLASPKVANHVRFGWVSLRIQVLVIIASVISFFVAIGCGYIYVLPSVSHALLNAQGLLSDHNDNELLTSCDVFDGSWVQVQGYPLYNATECPFVEKGFNCLGNGRVDTDYLSWRWKPKGCNIPTFDVRSVLEMLRSKRVVFVGDSMSRTQWESMICMLMAGVEDKSGVYEVNQNNITKRIRFLGVRFSAFNFTIEFFRSVFLVQQGNLPRYMQRPRRVKSTLMLDKLDDISDQWVNSDVLIFNTGHWWVPSKLFDM
ncbi:hypothetical protein Ahy_A03g012118 isoform B [Arachis hypogaea]|nr:hypothetical protein Ahy_A03g012118 isoform B [Arachis hypogaea]